MDSSVFMDKNKQPTAEDLESAVGTTFYIWKQMRDYVFKLHPNAIEEWNYPGKKYGWSFRIKDKKRAIIYLLPREKFFKVAFVFGQKATDQIYRSDVSENIKAELKNARVYAEGRGISLDVKNNSAIDDIKKLVQVKLAN